MYLHIPLCVVSVMHVHKGMHVCCNYVVCCVFGFPSTRLSLVLVLFVLFVLSCQANQSTSPWCLMVTAPFVLANWLIYKLYPLKKTSVHENMRKSTSKHAVHLPYLRLGVVMVVEEFLIQERKE